MKWIKKFEYYDDPIFLTQVKKPVEIRINIEAIEHAIERMGRHGYTKKVDSGYTKSLPNITKEDIKETIEKGIEELTIALMQDRFSIYDNNDNFDRFVFRNDDNYLNIVCELEPGDQSFSLVVITVMKDYNFKIGKNQFTIIVSSKKCSSGYWNPIKKDIEY